MLRCHVALLLLLLAFSAGCGATWQEPGPISLWSASTYTDPSLQSAQSLARQATSAERDRCSECVDLHYRAALASWAIVVACDSATPEFEQAWNLYHTSVARLLTTSRDFGRFAPGQGITLAGPSGPICVPVVLHGLPWRCDDVQAMSPVGDYHTSAISRQYACSGWGVPLVVQRTCSTQQYREESFLAPDAVFAATALLRPAASGQGAVLELFNPLRPADAPFQGVSPLATDLSAPFALREVKSPELSSGWAPFIGAETSIREGLFFVEPYQPGKVPVVMVHGLLSSPMSWVDMANDLRAIPGFTDRFQLWAFRYATGKPFLGAAARLRRDLYRAVATVDPAASDPALQNMVLIGHSMGGLVSQLQVSYSEDLLWSSVANRPLESIVTSEPTRAQLRELFFFEPQPNVRRVIQLATPHEGSSWANRPIGWIGSSLVRADATETARHQQLRRDNPGVFSPEVERGVPTSIDMLDPNSTVLKTIAGLRTNPCVNFHSVYGYGCWSLFKGPGDGVVAMQSATYPRAVSQQGVKATHTSVHRKLDTVNEVSRILQQHLANLDEGDGSH